MSDAEEVAGGDLTLDVASGDLTPFELSLRAAA